MTCSIPTCTAAATAREWCGRHYARWYRTGDPLGARPSRWEKETILQRFFGHITMTQAGCWSWDRVNEKGYGGFTAENKQWRAHRWSYTYFVGLISADKEIDHLCRNRACVNPDHLEAVTAWDNQHRSPITNATKTHCPKGHQYDEANTYIMTRGTRAGRRICRACKVMHDRRYHAMRRIAVNP